MTLDEGHSNWHGLKGLATKYNSAKFHDCCTQTAWENVHIWVFLDFPSTPGTMTLDEGHSNWYILIDLATKYYCAKFHDCSTHTLWENGHGFFPKIFNRAMWIWLWMKVTRTDMVWKTLPQGTMCPSFMSAVLILHEKMSMFEFSKIFHRPLWPWLWTKVTQTDTIW